MCVCVCVCVCVCFLVSITFFVYLVLCQSFFFFCLDITKFFDFFSDNTYVFSLLFFLWNFFPKYQFVYLFIYNLDHLRFFHTARVKVRDQPKIVIHYIYIYIYKLSVLYGSET